MNARARRGLALLLAATLALAGCTSSGGGKTGGDTESSGVPAKPKAIKIGTLATQDALPLWVAEEKGYFTGAGLPSAEIVKFQSAQESIVALQAGEVDGLMTDLIVSANLRASGTKVVLPTVMLGATTEQGRFAVCGAPGTDLKSMADLKGVPVGTASATITEYVLDKLMDEAGVPAADVKKEEVKKMPVRFQLLLSGKLKAASLPEPFVTLAVDQGGYIIPGGDDTKARQNISQSVLCMRADVVSGAEGKATLDAILAAWNKAVDAINTSPDAFRQTLVTNAGLPPELSARYPVSDYPRAAPPTEAEIQSVLDWMKAKGYLKAEVTSQELLQGK